MRRADNAIVHSIVAVMCVAASVLLPASAPPTGKTVPVQPSILLPRMVDVGAGKCIPCRKMAPIIEEMKEDYAAIVDIVFVDVWKDPKAGRPYRIRVIPTQVFYDIEGKEVFRHEGFMSREEIEKVFQEKMGVTPVKHEPKPLRSEAGLPPDRDALG